MFSPIQIKYEYVRGEDISRNDRIGTPTDSKYPLFSNQDANCKYQQLPQFWDYGQPPINLPHNNEPYTCQNMLQTETNESYSPVKNYLQHGITYQTNQHQKEITTETQYSNRNESDEKDKIQQIQISLQQSKAISETSSVTQSVEPTKYSRLGRPAKSLSDNTTGKKLKCQCEICFKEFGHKSNLFIHMRTHNGERPYKCNQCEKCFTHSGNLAIHMRTHSGERPYGCQICGKMFSHSGNLSTHLRTHSGVKPYKCSICAKEFRHSGNLSIHERIHSGIKPFQCKICGKDFYHSGNLTTHMKKHTVNTNADADFCDNNGTQFQNKKDKNNDLPSNLSNSVTVPSSTHDVKLMHNAVNMISIKREHADVPKSDNISTLTSTTR